MEMGDINYHDLSYLRVGIQQGVLQQLHQCQPVLTKRVRGEAVSTYLLVGLGESINGGVGGGHYCDGISQLNGLEAGRKKMKILGSKKREWS